MNISAIMALARPAFEFMYDKKATISRNVEYEKPNGATGEDFKPIYEEVPCRLSRKKLDNLTQVGAAKVEYVETVFLSPEYKVLAGDVFTVEGKTYEAAHDPYELTSQQEVVVTFKGYA